jgi:signal transduction histidine kinase
VLLVFQEAINNILRHAQARTVALRLGVNETTLEGDIIDDGRGIDTAQVDGDGRGLSNMRSRARALGGELTVSDATGGGTRVQLAVPLRS